MKSTRTLAVGLGINLLVLSVTAFGRTGAPVSEVSTRAVSTGRSAQPASALVIPPALDVETPPTQLALLFDDGSRQSVTLTVEGYSAVLVQIPL